MQSVQNNPHKSVNLFKPISFIIFITFYSPIILAMGCLGMSFIFQNFKGFLYIFWLLVVSFMREAVLMWSGIDPNNAIDKPAICSMAQWKFSHYGASGYSIFCLLYTSPSPRDGLLSRMPSSA